MENENNHPEPLPAELLEKIAYYSDAQRRIPFTETHVLNLTTPDGHYEFYTESVSKYQVTINGDDRSVVRINDAHTLRKDAQSISLYDLKIAVGSSGRLLLTPLGEGNVTIRLTSRVKTIVALP